MLPHEYNHFQITFSVVNISSGIKNSKPIALMVLIHVEFFVFHVVCWLWCTYYTYSTVECCVVIVRTNTSHKTLCDVTLRKEHSKYFDHPNLLLHSFDASFWQVWCFIFSILLLYYHRYLVLLKYPGTRSIAMIAPSIIVMLAFQLCAVSSYQLSSRRMEVTMVSSNPFGGFLNNMKQPASSSGKLFSTRFNQYQ